ncbi:MAG: hypothetical protein N0E48_25160 [Candidatus Thiodiazotropha endolucinida]|nr:hypothetical protein [Candidatus Thiodiazotropha taylori]MCW4346616.1 hypothetical protein [Candidatus Thiodiazotropha endolucinida]
MVTTQTFTQLIRRPFRQHRQARRSLPRRPHQRRAPLDIQQGQPPKHHTRTPIARHLTQCLINPQRLPMTLPVKHLSPVNTHPNITQRLALTHRQHVHQSRPHRARSPKQILRFARKHRRIRLKPNPIRIRPRIPRQQRRVLIFDHPARPRIPCLKNRHRP